MKVAAPGAAQRRSHPICQACGEPLFPRAGPGRPNLYYHTACRANLPKDIQKADQNDRQFRSRSTRRQVLKAAGGLIVLPFVSSFPQSKIDPASYWKWLAALRKSLTRGEVVKARQGALDLIGALTEVYHPDEELLRIHCWEIIRDAGAKGNRQAFVSTALPWAKKVTERWFQLGKLDHVAASLLPCVELYRLRGDQGKAHSLVKSAEVFARKADPSDSRREVAAIRHEAIRYQVRFTGRRMNELLSLGRDIGLPQTFFHTKREQTLLLLSQFSCRSQERIRQRLEDLLDEQNELFTQSGHSQRTYLHLLNARLAFFQLTEEVTKQKQVVEEFRSVFARCPDAYQLDWFKRLRAGKNERDVQDLKAENAQFYLASDLLYSLAGYTERGDF